MKGRNVFGTIVLGIVVAAIVISLPDIKRYIRISTM